MVTMADIETEASELEDEIARLEGEIERLPEDEPENTREVLGEQRDALADKLEPLEDFVRIVAQAGIDDDAVDAALDCSRGDLAQAGMLVHYGVNSYGSVREYGESMAEGMGDQIGSFYNYIDFEAYGNDCLADVDYHEFEGRIYVFMT